MESGIEQGIAKRTHKVLAEVCVMERLLNMTFASAQVKHFVVIFCLTSC